MFVSEDGTIVAGHGAHISSAQPPHRRCSGDNRDAIDDNKLTLNGGGDEEYLALSLVSSKS